MKRRTLLSALALCTAVPRVLLAQHEGHGSGGKRRRAVAMNAAFAPDGSLWVVALNERRQLFVQRSADGGARWSTPRVLDTDQDTIAAEGESRPKLRFGPKGWAVIAYTRPLSKPYSGEIRMLRSEDGGATFSAPFTVHRDRQIITHRFESVEFDSTGALHTLWIDKRDMKPGYVGAALYRNVSLDGGRTFAPDLKLADHTCECCRIALAEAEDGGLAAMWRHVFEGGIRDHAFARIAPGGREVSPIVRATFDDWRIDACPHHGPGLARAAGGGFHAVWFGVRNAEPAVRYARLDPAGQPGSDVRVIPDAAAEHADVCSVGARTVVAWRRFDGQRTRYVAWISEDDGKSFRERQLGTLEADADYPILVRRKSDVFVLWRGGDEIHARMAVASPKTVERFDATTWARMQKELPRPAAVVFTATYCASCPAIIERIAEALRKRSLAQPIIAVVVDETNSEKLLSSHHYASASQLFAFDGDESRLRYGVDPRWRGVTPYTALLGNQDKITFVAGTPSTEQIEAWLAQMEGCSSDAVSKAERYRPTPKTM